MSQLPSLITKVSNLNVETSRKVSAFLGAVVGDAASLHLEWIYDQAKVLDIVGGKDKDPAFWPDSHVPFFTLPNGKVSCYNDEAIQALSVMAKNDGKYDTGKLIDHFLIHFGDPESPYQIAKAKRVDKKYPIEGKNPLFCYIPQSQISFILSFFRSMDSRNFDQHDGSIQGWNQSTRPRRC